MANEKRLIWDVDMKTAFREWFDHEDFRTMNQVIDDIPTVDAVEVVRCKDCYLGENCTCVCCEDGEMVLCRLHHKHMDADAFCSQGWRE